MKPFLHLSWIYLILLSSICSPSIATSQYNSDFEEILTQPVLLQTEKGRGTGFFYKYNSFLYLITARHVIVDTNNSAPSKLLLTFYPQGSICNEAMQFEISLEQAHAKGAVKYATSHDFLFLEIARIEGLKFHFPGYVKPLKSSPLLPKFFPQGAFTNLDSLGIGAEVYLFGYPVSLGEMNQFDFNRPIMRTGTIAARSCANIGDRPKDYSVLVDARVDHGMSGGFVMIKTGKRKYSLIGIMIQLVPYIKGGDIANSTKSKVEYENSGLSIILSFDTIANAIYKYDKDRE